MAYADCIDAALIEPKQQLEFNLRSVYRGEVKTRKVRVKRLKNFEYESIDQSKSYDSRTQSVLGVIETESSFSSMFGRKKSLGKRFALFNVSRLKIEDAILKKQNIEFLISTESTAIENSLEKSELHNSKDNISKVHFQSKININYVSDDTFRLNGCNFEISIFEKIDTLTETSDNQSRPYIGRTLRSRFYFSKQLLYPVRQQSFKDGQWVDFLTVTSARIVR